MASIADGMCPREAAQLAVESADFLALELDGEATVVEACETPEPEDDPHILQMVSEL